MNFFDRLSNGWKLTMNSFKVLKENKQLIVFPLLSGISLLLVIGSFFVIKLSNANWDVNNIDEPNTVGTYALVFLFYVVNYFIVVFFNIALIHCTRLYFRGEEVTIGKGLQYSVSRIGVIFSWALFAATVGMILKAIQENSGLVGKIISGVIGIVWSIATFFVVPVIAYENVGPLQAVKRSSQMMKDKWGESLSASFSLGLIQFLGMIIVGLPLYIIGAILSPFVGIALCILGMFIVVAIISATHTIFVSAVYHNIKDEPVKHFANEMINNLFEKKNKS